MCDRDTATVDLALLREHADVVRETARAVEATATRAGLTLRQMLALVEIAKELSYSTVGPPRLAPTGERASSNIPATAVRPAHRRRRITRERLQEIARVYREAEAAGAAPTKTVAEHFGKSHSTAARWVGLARKAGHLEPTDWGRHTGGAAHLETD